MTKLHRKELKQDEIREKVHDAVVGLSLHRTEIVYIITIILAVGIIAFAWYYYENRQQEQSQKALGDALDKLQSQVGEQPNIPNAPKPAHSYKTEQEKYADALKDFEQIAQQYGNTPAADMARYQAGLCAFYLKDNGKAEQYLKQSIRVSEKNILFYLSREALADLYNTMGKSEDAISVLKEAADRNKNVVPQETLLLKLGESYTKAGKTKEATDTFQKILDQYKESPVSYEAQMRLSEIKGK
ncbi:MAG: hypothetical protein C5B54_00570 [Acidobacteria bacterium]|nr:MAG: hypothetical protein C5B54_00570 [Acidobacteriota bacterium]